MSEATYVFHSTARCPADAWCVLISAARSTALFPGRCHVPNCISVSAAACHAPRAGPRPMLLPETVTPRQGYACLTAPAPNGPSRRAWRQASTSSSGMTAVLTLHRHSSSPNRMPSRAGPPSISRSRNSRMAGGRPRSLVHPSPASEISTGRAAKATAAHANSTSASTQAHRCISVCNPAHRLTATRNIMAASACRGPRTRHMRSSTYVGVAAWTVAANADKIGSKQMFQVSGDDVPPMPTPRCSALGLVTPVARIEQTCRPTTMTRNAATIHRGIRHPARTSRSHVCESRSKALDWSAATTAAVRRSPPSSTSSVSLRHAAPAGPRTWFQRGPNGCSSGARCAEPRCWNASRMFPPQFRPLTPAWNGEKLASSGGPASLTSPAPKCRRRQPGSWSPRIPSAGCVPLALGIHMSKSTLGPSTPSGSPSSLSVAWKA